VIDESAAGGWALDLNRGEQSRAHGDIEIGVPAAGSYVLDVFREPHDGDIWICRRDDTIRWPFRQIICQSQDGIPYLAPQAGTGCDARCGGSIPATPGSACCDQP
jgi:hypothetical protein